MSRRWTIKEVEGVIARKQPPVKVPKGAPVPRIPRRSKEKEWIAYVLMAWCGQRRLQLETEYQFHPVRKWRFDWAIPALKIGVEYEGLFSAKSRHLTIGGYIADCEKYNELQIIGWNVLRYTANNYKKKLIEDLDRVYQSKMSTNEK